MEVIDLIQCFFYRHSDLTAALSCVKNSEGELAKVKLSSYNWLKFTKSWLFPFNIKLSVRDTQRFDL